MSAPPRSWPYNARLSESGQRSCGKVVFVGSETREFQARQVRHLQERCKQGFWAGYEGLAGLLHYCDPVSSIISPRSAPSGVLSYREIMLGVRRSQPYQDFFWCRFAHAACFPLVRRMDSRGCWRSAEMPNEPRCHPTAAMAI